MKNPFVILTNPRSGSSWVVSMLRSREDITVMGELFHTPLNTTRDKSKDQSVERWSLYKKNKCKHVIPGLTLFQYLDHVYATAHHAGFKLMFLQMLKTPAIILYLIVKRVRVVHLRRENVLDILVSKESMNIRLLAHSNQEVEQIKIYLDPEETIRQIRFLLRVERMTALFCRMIPVRVWSVSYEELVHYPQSWMRMQKFICPNKDEKSLISPSKKLNKLPKSQMIENFDALYSHLDDNGLAYLCEEMTAS